jgi:hypothetical protein
VSGLTIEVAAEQRNPSERHSPGRGQGHKNKKRRAGGTLKIEEVGKHTSMVDFCEQSMYYFCSFVLLTKFFASTYSKFSPIMVELGVCSFDYSVIQSLL